MDKLIDDLWINLLGYYDQFIEILPKFVVATITFSILILLANKAKKVVTVQLSKQMDDPLLARFLGTVVKVVGIVVAVMLVFQILGLGDIAAGIFAGASFSAVLVGFAFKDIGENFLAGIILAFNRPFRVGDTVELDGQKGVVVTLDMRTSHIKTFDGKDVYIPNASIVKTPVVNYTIDGYIRQDFIIGLDYGANVDEAIDLITNALEAVDGILTDAKKVNVFTSNLNSSTLDLTVQYWLDTFDSKVSGAVVKTNAINSVLKNLTEAGYYLPGNVIELKNYNSDDLQAIN